MATFNLVSHKNIMLFLNALHNMFKKCNSSDCHKYIFFEQCWATISKLDYSLLCQFILKCLMFKVVHFSIFKNDEFIWQLSVIIMSLRYNNDDCVFCVSWWTGVLHRWSPAVSAQDQIRPAAPIYIQLLIKPSITPPQRLLLMKWHKPSLHGHIQLWGICSTVSILSNKSNYLG